ncbi:universal stress protein [Kitasatospora sp. NPDC050543]|uniref:universal stress protein n=1 Tax=Kitasatospora sp. NPDC050543 TaxID=3364054 RepID=UPI0037B0C48D
MNGHGGHGPPVLVGVDPGTQGGGVGDIVRFAAREAQLHRTALRLLHVVDRTERAPAPAEGGLPEQAGAGVLAPYSALVRAEFPGLDVAEHTEPGKPASVLVTRSGEGAMIVLGHRGHGGFPRLPLGSVALQVATNARCPVVVVRPAPAERDAPVVVGFDLPEDSLDALEFACTEAGARGAPLEIVHADFHPQVLPPGMAPPGQTDQGEIVRAERQFLEAEAAQVRERHPGLTVRVRVAHTNATSALLAAGADAALLVVGTHQRSALARLLLGSVAGEVLHRARCPVAVVPKAGTGTRTGAGTEEAG